MFLWRNKQNYPLIITKYPPYLFTPRKYWLITQEAMAPSRHDWKIVDWDVKPQHNQQPPYLFFWGCNVKPDISQ